MSIFEELFANIPEFRDPLISLKNTVRDSIRSLDSLEASNGIMHNLQAIESIDAVGNANRYSQRYDSVNQVDYSLMNKMRNLNINVYKQVMGDDIYV